MSALAVVKRSDERLLNRERPVEGPGVAPRLESVRFGNLPVTKLGGLIVEKAHPDAERDLALILHRGHEAAVRSRGQRRVSTKDEERVDLARGHIGRESLNGV